MFKELINKYKAQKEERERSQGYNPYFLAEVQSQGGIKFEESYIKKGDGYEVSIHVYDFQTIVSDFWLEQIMNMPNVVASLDITTPNRKEIITNLNRSMSEQTVRTINAKDTHDLLDATHSYQELQEIYEEIKQGEVMKRIILRLFVSAKTLDQLEYDVKTVIDTLESYNFRGTVLLNEQEYEWEGLFKNYTEQQKYPNKRKGIEIPSLSLAGGFPFHFTALNDPYGIHYGTTETNGNVIWDLFHNDQNRRFYNAVMIGKMGSGKSTFLKKVGLDYGSKGYKIRILDITGEFEELTNELAGKVVALDGSSGKINPLQVYKTATHRDGTTNEELSFTQHLSKMSVFYRFLNPEASNSEIKEYENILRELYIQHGLWTEENQENSITENTADAYPIFTDFLNHLRNVLYEDFENGKVFENIGESRRKRLENIELNISNLVKNYGNLFDGHSSIDNFEDEHFVSFPLRNLSELKPEIFQAQLFNVMNMLWDGMLNNGQPQFQAYNKKQLLFEDAIRYLIIIDEAHHIINAREGSEHAVQYLQRFAREARKYFGGLLFASHLIQDFVPNNADQSRAEEVKKLFDLTQYKLIGEQDSESLPKIKEVFEGQLNESELQQIPYLQKGQFMLSISSVKNIKMNVDVSKKELEMFGGGA